MSPKPSQILALLLFGVVLALHLLGLHQDPPHDLSFSVAPFTDEGVYLHNARNRIVYGDWAVDEFNPMYLHPLFTGLAYVAMRLGGVDVVPVRVLSVCFNLIMLAGVGLLAARSYGSQPRDGVGALLVALLGSNAAFIAFGRSALMEPATNFFLVWAFVLFVFSDRNVRLAALSGLAWTAAFFVKSSAIIGLPVVGVALLLEFSLHREHRPIVLATARWFAGGVGVGVSIWLVSIGYEHWAEFVENSRLILMNAPKLPASGGEWLENLRVLPEIFRMAPVETAMTIGCCASVLTCPANRSRAWLTLLCWVLLGVAYTSSLTYRPTRYSLFMLPAVALGASLMLRRIWHGERMRSSIVLTMASLLLALLWSQSSEQRYAPPEIGGRQWYWLGLAAIGLALSLLASPTSRGLRAARCGCLLLVVSALAFQTTRWVPWLSLPRHTVREAAAEIDAVVGDSVVAGTWALAFEPYARYHGLQVHEHGIHDAPSTLERLEARYFLYETGQLEMVTRQFSPYLSQFRPLAKFPVGRWQIELRERTAQPLGTPPADPTDERDVDQPPSPTK